jgi:hypothetical protein
MRPTLLIALAALTCATAADAQTVQQKGRYSLVVVDDGFIRLDTVSGEIARCTGDPDKLTCRLAADERMAYVDEIDRLEGRIDELEDRVARLEDAAVAPRLGNGRDFGLPSDEEIDEALDMTDKVFRRFFGMVRELKRDLEEDRL